LLETGDSKDRELFLRFMRKMLQWEPEKRSSARELLQDEWLHSWREKGNAELMSLNQQHSG
jgi:serine/threonine protein kinase